MGRGTSRAATMRRMSGEPRNSRIQREVVQLILDRKLQPGAPLPTEAELMEDLGISRNSVREALKALQALDIVEIRHGYGTYVGRASLTPLVDGLTFRTLTRHEDDADALAEILQVREVLEEGLIHRVVATVTEPELDGLAAVVTRMEEAGRAGRPLPELDREFHELSTPHSATNSSPNSSAPSGRSSAGSPAPEAGPTTLTRPSPSTATATSSPRCAPAMWRGPSGRWRTTSAGSRHGRHRSRGGGVRFSGGGSTTGSVKPARFSRAGRVPGSRVFIVSRKCNTRQREPGWLSLPANTPPGRSTRDALSVEQPIRCSSHRASCAPASSFTAASTG